MMTEMERRKRLLELVEADERCGEMLRECVSARADLEEYTKGLPKEQQEFLWHYPGAMYYLFHWTLNLVCKHMRFGDELQESE
jgi:hypothetical protein